MEIIGRDKITQTGNKAKLKIDNRKSNKVGWHEKWWEKIIIGLIIAVIAGVILHFLI